MAVNKYTPNREGLRQLAKSAEMGAAMVEAAEHGKEWAQANSPVDTGEYATSFHVQQVTVEAGWSNEPRAGAALINTAPHGGIVEHHHHVLARAVDAIENG